MVVTPGGSSPVNISVSFTASSGSGTTTTAAQILLSPSAFSTPVTVAMQVYGADVAPAPSLGQFTVQGNTFQITATDSNGNTLEPSAGSSVTLTFPYDAQALAAAGESPSQLEVAYFDGTSWTSLTGTPNTLLDTITVVTNHFSIWAVVLKTPATPAVPVSEVGKAAFGPVPAKQGDPLALYFDRAPASGSFQVYNVAGQRVAEDSFGSSGASLQTGSLAPGIYLARIVVNYEDGSSRTELQKIIIVR